MYPCSIQAIFTCHGTSCFKVVHVESDTVAWDRMSEFVDKLVSCKVYLHGGIEAAEKPLYPKCKWSHLNGELLYFLSTSSQKVLG